MTDLDLIDSNRNQHFFLLVNNILWLLFIWRFSNYFNEYTMVSVEF